MVEKTGIDDLWAGRAVGIVENGMEWRRKRTEK
jgi:hypothetical protein